MYTICAQPLFSKLFKQSLLCSISQILRLTFFCEILQKMRIENMTIKSTIDAMLKNGELEEIIENGRIKLRATHQDI